MLRSEDKFPSLFYRNTCSKSTLCTVFGQCVSTPDHDLLSSPTSSIDRQSGMVVDPLNVLFGLAVHFEETSSVSAQLPELYWQSATSTGRNSKILWTLDIKTWPQEDIRRHPTTWSACLFRSPSASMLQSSGSVGLERDRTFPGVRRMVCTFVTLTGLVLACHPSKEPWASNSHHTIHMCKDMIKIFILVAAGPIFGWSEEVDVQRWSEV